MNWEKHLARIAEKKTYVKIPIQKSERRLIESSRLRWEDKMKVDFKGIGW
jgi:hypothetical protein